MWDSNWIIGDAARLSAVITDAAGAALDPAVLRLKTKNSAGTITTYAYGAGADIVRDAIGRYHADIALTSAGQWAWRWETDAPAAGAAEGAISVARSRI